MSSRRKSFLASLIFLGTMGLACICWSAPALSHESEAHVWNAVQTKGHVVLLRHAMAPGVGDPPGFTVGNCDTQRNLSNEGRAQAIKIGERFRANGIRKAQIFSSQWCRCLDTAKLLALGTVQELPILNSFFEESEREQQQMQALRNWLAKQALDKPMVLITHQVNITALTGIYPSSGELLVIRVSKDGSTSVIGNIKID